MRLHTPQKKFLFMKGDNSKNSSTISARLKQQNTTRLIGCTIRLKGTHGTTTHYSVNGFRINMRRRLLNITRPNSLSVISRQRPYRPTRLIQRVMQASRRFLHRVFRQGLTNMIPVSMTNRNMSFLNSKVTRLLQLVTTFTRVLYRNNRGLRGVTISRLLHRQNR